MNQPAILDSVIEHLARNWDVVPVAIHSREELEARMARVLKNMLTDHFAELTQILYRIDLPEAQFHAALQARTLDEAARKLAHHLVEREIQKAHTRRAWAADQDLGSL